MKESDNTFIISYLVITIRKGIITVNENKQGYCSLNEYK